MKLKVYMLQHDQVEHAGLEEVYFTRTLFLLAPCERRDYWYKTKLKECHRDWQRLVRKQSKLIGKPLYELVCPSMEIEI